MISAFPHEAPEPLVSTHTESCDPPDAARDALAVFAHELRSPLAAALQGLQLLCLSRADQAAQARALDLIQRQLRHAARLVEVTLADARGRSVAGSGSGRRPAGPRRPQMAAARLRRECREHARPAGTSRHVGSPSCRESPCQIKLLLAPRRSPYPPTAARSRSLRRAATCWRRCRLDPSGTSSTTNFPTAWSLTARATTARRGKGAGAAPPRPAWASSPSPWLPRPPTTS